MTDDAREARRLQKELRQFCGSVRLCLSELDKAMENPSTVERGRRIAAIANQLQMAFDGARHFGLGEKL